MQSDVFRNYALIVGGVLGLAGLALALMKWGFKKEVHSIWLTYRSWLVMAPLIVGCVFGGRVVVIAFVCLVARSRLQGICPRHRPVQGLVDDRGGLSGHRRGRGDVLDASAARRASRGRGGMVCLSRCRFMPWLSFCMIPIVRNRVQGSFSPCRWRSLGSLYIGWMFGHLAFLANATNAYGYLLYILFATEINDVAAFTCGKLFGKRPFRSNISPKKTWGGAIGALAVSMALPWLLRFSFPHFGATQLMLAGLIVGIGGQLGDLSISVIKRDIGIKDMGAGIPGHGGILDRIDSLIYVSPLFFHMAGYFYGLR